MAVAATDDGKAAKSKLEFGIFRGSFQQSYMAWSSAPSDLRSAMLLRGASLVRAEHWLLAFPDKLSDGEKRFIMRSIAQAADDDGKRPEFRIEPTHRLEPWGLILLAGAALVTIWISMPNAVKFGMERAINGGLSEADIASLKAPARGKPVLAAKPEQSEPPRAAPTTPAFGPMAPLPRLASTGPLIAKPLPPPNAGAELEPLSPTAGHSRRVAALAQDRAAGTDRRSALLLAVEAVHAAAAEKPGTGRDAVAAPAISSLLQALASQVVVAAPADLSIAVQPTLFCPGGRNVLAAADPGRLQAWQLAATTPILTLERRRDLLRSAALDARCERLVVSDEDDIGEVWSLSTGQRVSRLVGHEAALLASAFSPDGRLVLTGSQDRTARLWDAGTGRQLALLAGHDWSVVGAAFSPDGRLAATASLDKTARLWDVPSGRLVRVLGEHHGAVTAVVFSPDGRYVVTTSADGTARLWSLERNGPATVLRAERSSILAARFSADGRHLATVTQEQRVEIRDTASGEVLRELAGRDGGVRSLALSPDGRWILTTTWKGEAVLWHAASGRETATLGNPGQHVTSADFAAGGQGVVALAASGALVSWPLPGSLAETIRHARKLAPDCLTSSERQSLGLEPAQPVWCRQAAELGPGEDWLVGSLPSRREASHLPSTE